MKRKQRILALESGSGYQIKDENGAVVTVAEARRRWEACEVDDYNGAFARLVHMGFDVDAVREYYSRDSRNRVI